MVVRGHPYDEIPLGVIRRLPKSACVDQTPLGSDGSSNATKLHPDDLRAIVNAVRVQSPWLNAEQAAEYLRCPVSRIRKLTMTRELPCERDGRRVLFSPRRAGHIHP